MPEQSLFREKSLEKVNSPERLNDYIQVVPVGLWVVLLSVLLLLFGALFWAGFGTVTIHTAEGAVKTVHPISFLWN